MLETKNQNDQWKISREEQKLFISETRFCDLCLKGSLSSHRCSACLAAQYCSTKCQEEDLNFHKSVCSFWAQDKSKRIIGKGKQKKHMKNLAEELLD